MAAADVDPACKDISLVRERTSIDYLIKSGQILVMKHTDQEQHPGQTEQGNKDCVQSNEESKSCFISVKSLPIRAVASLTPAYIFAETPHTALELGSAGMQ